MRRAVQRLNRDYKANSVKSIGKTLITWSKLEEVLLDIEVNLKNRPVLYEYLEY